MIDIRSFFTDICVTKTCHFIIPTILLSTFYIVLRLNALKCRYCRSRRLCCNHFKYKDTSRPFGLFMRALFSFWGFFHECCGNKLQGYCKGRLLRRGKYMYVLIRLFSHFNVQKNQIFCLPCNVKWLCNLGVLDFYSRQPSTSV